MLSKVEVGGGGGYDWLAGVKIKFIFIGASRAPSLMNLGALIEICWLCCRNVNTFFNFYVLTPEISRGLLSP